VSGGFKGRLFSWTTLASGALIGLSTVYLQSEGSNELRERAIAPLEFKLREKLSREHPFSNNLKVLIYGDKAKREFGVQELITIRQWADFIDQVASRQPTAIVFDKMFTFSLGSDADLEYFKATLARQKTKVIAAGTFNELAISEGNFDAQMLTNWTVENADAIPKGRLSRFIGPAPALRDSFFRFGGAQLNSAAAVHPAWLDIESNKMLPQLSFSYFNDAHVQDDKVTFGNTTMYLDRFGRIPVNFIDSKLAYKKFLPVNSIFRLGSQSPVLNKINSNDVVLVLPSMYTGSTDFKNSPVGRIAGGLYHASLINSVLTNAPIVPVLNGSLSILVVFALIAGCVWVLSSQLSFTRSVLSITTLSLAIAASGLLLFVFANLQSDWHVYSIFTALYGGGLLSIRAAKVEKDAQFAEILLEGLVSKDVLKQIKYKPDLWNLRPSEQSMTVMFVDIEGFSLRTKDLIPVDMFSILHTQINEIARIVHKNGGIIDRVLGDGMLCFFGFSFDDKKSEVQFDHARRALRCALEVQRSAVRLTTQTKTSERSFGAVLPLRIGICTGDTFFGNMGTDRRLDFTVIGHTVNMAKRYEDACETFRVFLSESTYQDLYEREQLSEFSDVMFFQRQMSMKHQIDLVRGWECDPFFNLKDVYQGALDKINAESKDSTLSGRIKPKHAVRVKINDFFDGLLVEFDSNKYVIETNSYFCRKVNLVIELSSDIEDINTQLAVTHMKTLHFHVSIGQALSENHFRHELLLLNVTPEKRNVLLKLLSQSE
jgi:class 3 adenylate cyclase